MQISQLRRFALVASVGSSLAVGVAAQQLYPLGGMHSGSSARALVVADFDEDGYLDCAVANAFHTTAAGGTKGVSTLEVFRNDRMRGQTPLGVHLAPNSFASGFDAAAAVGDFNEDGHADVVFGGDAGLPRLLLGDGDGGFQPGAMPFAQNVEFVQVADVDGDGHQDLLVATASDDKIELRLGDGAGGFVAGQVLATGSSEDVNDAAAVDLDRDGDLDVIAMVAFTTGPKLFVNQGGGVFAPTPTSYPLAGAFFNRVIVADVDGDGFSDALTLHNANPTGFVGVFLSVNGAAQIAPFTFAIPAIPFEAAVGDLDDDGWPDLAIACTGELEIHFGTGGSGAAMFAAPVRYQKGYSPGVLAVDDFDHDGFGDVAFTSGVQGLVVSYGDDHGEFVEADALTIAAPPRGLTSGDFDGDADADVIVSVGAGVQSKGFLAYPGDGAGGFGAPIATAFVGAAEPGAIDAGDANGDGVLDLVSAESPTTQPGKVGVWLGSGAGAFALATTLTTSASCDEARLVDLDVDGIVDVLGRSYVGNALIVWRGLGAGTFAAAVQYASPQQVYAFEIGYVDGDALPDVVTASHDGLTSAVYLNVGGAAFALVNLLQTPPWRPLDVAIGDVDGDGIADVVSHGSQASTSTMLVYYAGFGNGTFAPGVVLDEQFAYAIDLADVDGDGRLDVCSGSTGLLSVTRSAGGGAFAPTRVFGAVAGTPSTFLLHEHVDLDGNGRPDSVQLAPRSGNTAVLGWLLHRDGDASTTIYCDAKLNSEGCAPSIGSSGAPSATASSGFVVTCVDVVNQKPGRLFYGLGGPQNLPFQGGTLCLALPLKRTPGTSSGGNPPPATDCSGSYSIDFNAFIASGTGAPALQVPGTNVHVQWWGRDPAHPDAFKVQLSNALAFVIGL